VTASGRGTFPLVPRWRVTGVPFGDQRSIRRGPGSDVAGSRGYRPGDPVSAIDWHASARLSAARGADEFVVREHFAEEAPRAVVLCDRRPSMALYAPPFPWLSKPDVAAAAADAIAISTLAARGEVGYLDHAGDGRPFWLAPRSRARRREIADRLSGAGFEAPENSLEQGLAHLTRMRADLPSGSFVFVISDFLAPPPVGSWVRTVALRWDVVPVVVQDPVWEQSFPDVRGVIVPLVDAATGRVSSVRLSTAEARARRLAHEQRLRSLLVGLRRLGLDPLLLGTAEPAAIDREFLTWAERRRQRRRRAR
jgi:uncharacterized protein (DUF58 family)